MIPAAASATIGDLVERITRELAASGISHAGTEARDLVAIVAGEGRFWPRLNAQSNASADLEERAGIAAARRAGGMPFAYAVKRAAFRHLTLSVDARVLIPRQETEQLIDLVLQRAKHGVVADVGTGSGAIALALADEGHFERIIATDVSADALVVARGNVAALRTESTPVEFRCGELLSPLAGERLDVLVSNPPYIAHEEAGELPASVRDWEPAPALFSGDHGLAATRRIIQGAPQLLCTGGLLALEVDSRRAQHVVDFVVSSGMFNAVQRHQDLTGRDRFVLATRA